MSYQVTARKWRPKTFKDLIGQDHITQTLINALRAERLPHALLFSGTRGVGKTSSARVLAKTILCPDAVDFVPCSTCSVCEEIAAGNHVDVIEIDGASNNGVDAIRELRETVGYMPAGGKYKIYIIDEVHMLTTSAFNALLKTLEEPPPHVVFVMATTEPQKIPVTILSRCQRFDFRRISTRVLKEQIENICKKENVEFESEALWLIARLADGSSRDGLSLLDQVINFTGAKLTQKNVVDVLGLTDRNLLMTSLEAFVNRDLSLITNVIEKIFSAGYDPANFMKDLLEEVRHMLLAKLSTTKTPLLDLADSEIESLKKIAESLSQEDIHLLFDMALKGSMDVLRAQSPRVVLEMVLLRMAQAPRVTEISQLLGSGIKTKTSSAPTARPIQNAPPTEPLKPPASVKPVAEVTSWESFVERAKTENPLLAAQLVNVSLVQMTDSMVTLGVTSTQKFMYEQLNTPKSLEKISILFKNIWNKTVGVQIQLSDDVPLSPNAIKQKSNEEKKRDIQQRVEAHPMVQNLKNVFKTEIQSVKELSPESSSSKQ